MKKFTALALFTALILSAPAFADDTPAGVASDVQDVQKDNQSLAKTNMDLAKHRASKAKNKATGNVTGQAVDSVKIGADKVSKSTKEAIKSSDQKTLDTDVDSAVAK